MPRDGGVPGSALAGQIKTTRITLKLSGAETPNDGDNRVSEFVRLPLFVMKNFRSHAGLSLSWKIECDSLTDEDLETLAMLIGERWRFGNVVGVPNGGLRLADKVRQYQKDTGPTLIVDDVLTTGTSMIEMQKQYPKAIGVVMFARGPCPSWVSSIFSLTSGENERID